MRAPAGRRRTAAAAFAVGVLGWSGGCLFPSDTSGDLRVEILGGTSQLYIGDSVTVGARVVDRRGSLVGNITFRFESSDPSVVFVDSAGRITGIGAGRAEVRASAVQLADAAPAALPVRVFEGIEVDAYVPAVTVSADGHTVRYGEALTLVGKGLDPAGLTVLQLGTYAPRVLRFVAADLSDTESRDSLTIIVPVRVPATADLVLALPNRGYVIAALEVIPEDVWEVGTTHPAGLGVVDSEVVLPDLVVEGGEAVPWDTTLIQTDWYRGTVGSSGAVSVVLKFNDESSPLRAFAAGDYPLLADIGPAWPDLFVDPAFSSVRPLHLDWGSGGLCAQALFGTFFYYYDRDSTMVSLKSLPAGTGAAQFDLAIWKVFPTDDPLPYEIRVVPEYLSVLPPDVAEENDLCDLAYPVPTDGQPLSLTLDHAEDLDWFKFTSTANPLVSASTTVTVAKSWSNNTFETADSVTLGTRVTGYTDPDLTDYYRFYAAAGTVLDIDVRAESDGSALDGYLFLYDPDGNYLAEADNESTDTSFTLDPRLRFPVRTSGWYTVEIAEAGLVCNCNPGIGGPNFYYALDITQFTAGSMLLAEMSSATEFEGRFDFFAAPPGPLGVPEPGYVWGLFPVRWAFFPQPNMSGGWTMTLHDHVPAGDYLLLVTDPPGGAINYTLSLTQYEIGVTAASALPAMPRLARRSAAQIQLLRERDAKQRELVLRRRDDPAGRLVPYR